MEPVDLNVIDQKLKDGKALTPAELKEVMSLPPEGNSNRTIAPEDDIKDEDFHDDQASKDKAAADKAAADKAAEKPAEDTKKPTEDAIKLLNTELDKPEGQENLKDFNEKEKAYFWEMRRSRKRAQAAEAERDQLKFDKAKEAAKKELAAKKAEEETPEEDPLKDIADDAAITGKELKALMAKITKKPTAKDTTQPRGIDLSSPLVTKALEMQESIARTELGADFDETVECSAEIIQNSPAYLTQIAEALLKGENIAKLTYSIIKADPEYAKALPQAKARMKAKGLKTSDDVEKKADEAGDDPKKKAALDAQKKLEDNKTKAKTSAHVDGTDQVSEKIDDYTLESLVAMNDKEFAKVPKKTREKFMKLYG